MRSEKGINTDGAASRMVRKWACWLPITICPKKSSFPCFFRMVLFLVSLIFLSGCLRAQLRDFCKSVDRAKLLSRGQWAELKESLDKELNGKSAEDFIGGDTGKGMHLCGLTGYYYELGDHETIIEIGDAVISLLKSLMAKSPKGENLQFQEWVIISNSQSLLSFYYRSCILVGEYDRIDETLALVDMCLDYYRQYAPPDIISLLEKNSILSPNKLEDQQLNIQLLRFAKLGGDGAGLLEKCQQRIDQFKSLRGTGKPTSYEELWLRWGVIEYGVGTKDSVLIMNNLAELENATPDIKGFSKKDRVIMGITALPALPLLVVMGADYGIWFYFRMWIPAVWSGSPIEVKDFDSGAKDFWSGYAKYLEANYSESSSVLEVYVKSFGGSTDVAGMSVCLALDCLGDCAERSGEIEKALNCYLRAISAAEIERSALRKDSYKRRFLMDRARPYERACCLLAEKGDIQKAFEIAERTKSRALADLLEGKELGKTQEVEAGYLAYRRQDLFAPYKKTEVASANSGDPLMISRSMESQQALDTLAARDKELASFVTAQSASWEQLSPSFGDVVLVEYMLGGQEGLVFIGEQGRLQVIPIKSTRAQVQELVQDFRKSILSGDVGAQAKGRALYDVLMRPAFPEGVPARLVIVPHGPLHTLPFAALHDGQSWLIEKSEISTLPAASILTYCREKAGRPRTTMLAFGNPDLTQTLPDVPVRNWSLPSAEREARAVGDLFGSGATVLTGADATEKAFREKAPQADIVHLACHGQFDQTSPSRSALFMAQGSGQDGRLESWEIMKTPLNASFVVMSACETALGEISAGDDVVGLTRGMLYAGTPSLMSTLWQVSDAATAELMVEFYQRLKASERPTQALRQAQLHLMGKAGSGTLVRRSVSVGLGTAEGEIPAPYSHPYFWAPFVVVGDWQ